MTNVELIEALCDTIARQAETIKQLSNELEQLRAISEEEDRLIREFPPKKDEEDESL